MMRSSTKRVGVAICVAALLVVGLAACGSDEVYKPICLEAQAAVALALYLRAGQEPPKGLVNGTTEDTTSNSNVKSVLLTPKSVDVSNLADTVIKDDFVTADDACTGEFKSLCQQAGIATP